MCSLDSFPNSPPRDYVTLCELESRLISSPAFEDLQKYTDKANSYPRVTISREMLRLSSSTDSAKNAFIQRDVSFWKKLAQAWFEQGTGGVLKELTLVEPNSPMKKGLSKMGRFLLPLFSWVQSWHFSLHPQLKMSSEEFVVEFSLASDWKDGLVRAFAWHPQTLKFAVAQADDTVKVYNSPSGIVPILKHKLQKDIADMAWKPYCASILALACKSGIIIWQLDPTSLVTRPSSTCMTLLSHKGHVGVTSISWHPLGLLLVSASPNDASMIVWDVSREVATPLKRYSGGGVSLVKWSPDGSRLFAGTPSTLFRVWETHTWTCEKWTKLSSRTQCCCWSPEGNFLLFATCDEPVIYYLAFQDPEEIAPYSVGGAKHAVPLANTSQISLLTDLRETRIGGCIKNMIWEKNGERLVVLFKDNPSLMAVYRTRLTPTFEIHPCGFIRGPALQIPQLISFHDSFSTGALLTVCWSNGQINHLPFLFVSSQGSSSLEIESLRLIGSQNTSNLGKSLFTTDEP